MAKLKNISDLLELRKNNPWLAEKLLRQLTPAQIQEFRYRWEFWGREDQMPPPGEWYVWLVLAGRGFGKTRMLAEWVRQRVKDGAKHIAIVGRTVADVRDVMINGESGLLAVHPPEERPIYIPSKRSVMWPGGAQATTFSSEAPEQLRGPQYDTAWCDELAAWEYPEAFVQVQIGARLGKNPRIAVSTTPQRKDIIRQLVKDAEDPKAVVITKGSTYANIANLASRSVAQVSRMFEGTRFGRQELYGELLDDVEGALWSREMIDKTRVSETPALKRVVVAVDPAMSAEKNSDETGIVVAGIGHDNRGYVLADRSGKYTPNQWAEIVRDLYHQYGADRVIAEKNQGGALVEANIRTAAPNIPYKAVHASQGKRTRAEPVAALYEQSRVSHVGTFEKLETQMVSWEPYGTVDVDTSKKPKVVQSPDRIDALVWAFTELMLGVYNKPSSLSYEDYDE